MRNGSSVRCELLRRSFFAAASAILLLSGCGEGDKIPFPDRLLKVAKVQRLAMAGQEREEKIRYWTRDPRTYNVPGDYGSYLAKYLLETATVDVGDVSLEVLFAYCKGPRTHVGFLVTNKSSKNVEFRWPGLGFTPRAFSLSPVSSSGARAGIRLAPQAMHLCVRGAQAVLIDKGEPRVYSSLDVSEDAFWMPSYQLAGGTYEVTHDTGRVLVVPAQSEAFLAACFRCRHVKKGELDLQFSVEDGETTVAYRFDMETAREKKARMR